MKRTYRVREGTSNRMHVQVLQSICNIPVISAGSLFQQTIIIIIHESLEFKVKILSKYFRRFSKEAQLSIVIPDLHHLRQIVPIKFSSQLSLYLSRYIFLTYRFVPFLTLGYQRLKYLRSPSLSPHPYKLRSQIVIDNSLSDLDVRTLAEYSTLYIVLDTLC